MVAAWALLIACGVPPAADGAPAADTGDTAPPDTPPDSGDSAPDTDTDDSGGDSTPPPRTDADGDGAFAEVDDCDDADADIHPGAAEGCDAVDSDCDGRPLAEGVCGEVQEVTAIGAGSWVGMEPEDAISAPRFVGDLDGDGSEDLGVLGGLSSGIPDSPPFPTVYYVPGGARPAWQTSIFDAAGAAWKADSTWTFPEHVRNAGDFDGDGQADLWILTRGATGANGGAFLKRGPASRWPMGGDLAASADALWYQERGGDGFGRGLVASDLDGDGLSDLAVGKFGYDGWTPGVHVIPGRSALPDDWVWVGDEPWIELSDGGDLNAVVTIGDIDGDGLTELAVGQDDVVSLLPGSALVGLDRADLADLRIVELRDGVDGSATIRRYGEEIAGLEDWTGDGTPDFALGSVGDGESDAGRVLFVDGAEAAAATGGDVWAVSPGWWDGAWAHASAGMNLEAVPDMDGDGLPEVGATYLSEGYSHSGALVTPSVRGAPEPGAIWADGALAIIGADDPSLGSPGVSAGDLDADGFPDLVFGNNDWGDDRGQAYLVAGWALPWDEAMWW